jgi:hypothetical protein
LLIINDRKNVIPLWCVVTTICLLYNDKKEKQNPLWCDGTMNFLLFNDRKDKIPFGVMAQRISCYLMTGKMKSPSGVMEQ